MIIFRVLGNVLGLAMLVGGGSTCEAVRTTNSLLPA